MKNHLFAIILLFSVAATAQTFVRIPFVQPNPFYVSLESVVKSLDPNISLELGLEVEIQGGSGIYTFLWTKDEVFLGNQPTLIVTHTGSYVLNIQDGEGCETVVVYDVIGETNISEVFADYVVHVYPNPTSQKVFVEPSGDSPLTRIDIYTVSGELILTMTSPDVSSNKIEIDLSGIDTGQYLLTCTFETKKITRIIMLK